MRALTVLGLFSILLFCLSLFSEKTDTTFNKSEEPELIFSKINQKSLNKLALDEEQKRRLIEIKFEKMKFSNF